MLVTSLNVVSDTACAMAVAKNENCLDTESLMDTEQMPAAQTHEPK
jgi:hypothetical protein